MSKVSLDLRDYLNLPDILGLTDIANDKTSAVCSGPQLASNASINFVETLEKERTGNEFWLAFMICALAVASAEMVLADRFSLSK